MTFKNNILIIDKLTTVIDLFKGNNFLWNLLHLWKKKLKRRTKRNVSIKADLLAWN